MLRRHRFDDAEAFARKFKLNVELVYKERAKHYMELLHPWSLSDGSSEEIVNFNNFISMMNNIEDIEFICEACMKMLTVDLAKMQALLDYASDRLKKTDVKVSDLCFTYSSVFRVKM